MATRKEIENLLKNVNITISKEELTYVYTSRPVRMSTTQTIEQYLLENAQYIDFKKLLVLVIYNLQDLERRYIGVSKKLEEDNRKEEKKAIAFAKRYIKPEEIIKVFIDAEIDGRKGILLVDSRIAIYEQEIEIEVESEKFNKIKKIIPDVENKEIRQVLSEALDDKVYGSMIEKILISESLTKQGNLKKLLQNESWAKKIELVENGILNEQLRNFLDNLKPYVNTDKYVLYHAHRLNEKLEQGKELTKKEKKFLEELKEISKFIDKKEKIKLDDKSSYGRRDVEKFLSRYNIEKHEYYTEEQIKTGEILLNEINGYEKYCSKDQLKELAQNENNLLYLAQRKLLNNATLYSIAIKYPISEETLVELYQCGSFSLRKIETLAKQQEMDINSIKEKIKQQKFKDCKDIDLKDEENWELLTAKERLQSVVNYIHTGKGKTIQERIKEIYDIQEIANLYKEIYHTEPKTKEESQKLEEKRRMYKNFIILHNYLGMQDKDDIVNILEDDFSNEMLVNLYNDHVISMDILESYGEKELVMDVFNQGRINELDIKETIMRYPIPLEEEQVYQYYQQGNVASKDIIELYVKNRINLDIVKRINEKLPEEQKIKLELKEEELAKLYQDTKKEKNRKNANLDVIMKYKRYGLLYQTLKRGNLSEEEKVESDKKILEHIMDVTEEDIMELYKDNLLTLETVLEYGNDELVKRLVLQGDLRTSDARIYFESEETKVGIEEILQDPNMDETEKLILIYTTYGDNVQKREKLVQENLSAYATNMKGEKITTRNTEDIKGTNDTKDTKNTITDPYERWKLLSLLDKNYSRKYIGGYLIVKLHNTQKAVIEKLYGKKYGEIKPGNNTATFCLPIEEYEKLESQLIKDKKFDITKLRSLSKNNPEKIAKITHHSARYDEKGNEKNSWVKRILEYVCEEEPEKIYSDEELKQIKECSKAIEASRKEIDR